MKIFQLFIFKVRKRLGSPFTLEENTIVIPIIMKHLEKPLKNANALRKYDKLQVNTIIRRCIILPSREVLCRYLLSTRALR